MDCVMGIDPGKSGGAALISIDGSDYRAVGFSRLTEKDMIHELNALLNAADVCVIEKVHSMPKQGVKSTFTFGQNYGFLRACILNQQIKMYEITPLTWQQKLNCRTKGDKNVSKAKAQRLFPNLKITHQIADALLIAEYGRRELCGLVLS